MKTIIAVTVIFSFFAVASAQSADCSNRFNGVASCQSKIATASSNLASFCRDCGNTYVSYLQDCVNGAGVAQVKQRKLIQTKGISE